MTLDWHHARLSSLGLSVGIATGVALAACSPDADQRSTLESISVEQLPAPDTSFQAVAVGGIGPTGFSCGLDDDRQLICWGGGQDTADIRQSPDDPQRAVAAGRDRVYAIDDQGEIHHWGPDFQGGDEPPKGRFVDIDAGRAACAIEQDSGHVDCWMRGDVIHETNPVADVPTGEFEQVGVGFAAACGLETDGSIVCWGRTSSDLRQQSPDGSFNQLSIGSRHGCAVTDDRRLECWGRGTSDGDDTDDYLTPPAGEFVDVGSGQHHSCGLTVDHQIQCWGLADAAPDPRDPDFDYQYTPQTQQPEGRYEAIDVGADHNCAVDSDGEIECWGINTNGQSTPPTTRFRQISTDLHNNCGVRRDGGVECWGGYITGVPWGLPADFEKVGVGRDFACGLRRSGELECWGPTNAEDGRLQPPDDDFERLAVGSNHACGLDDDGDVICWGSNDRRQLEPWDRDYEEIAGGHRHSCGITDADDVICWGNRHDNGPPWYLFWRSYVEVGTAQNPCALTDSGRVVCWRTDDPDGRYAKLGEHGTCGIDEQRRVDCWNEGETIAVLDDRDVQQVSARDGHRRGCALQSDGLARCWTGHEGPASRLRTRPVSE